MKSIVAMCYAIISAKRRYFLAVVAAAAVAFVVGGISPIGTGVVLRGLGFDPQLKIQLQLYPKVNAQGADSMYVSPANGTYTVGSSFTISVRVNTSSQVNAVQADLTYPTSNLEFISIDGGGSAFSVDARSTGGNGSVSIVRGNINPVSGDQLVSKVNFKVIAPGTAAIQVQNSSEALNSSNSANVISSRNGGLYTLAAAASPTSPNPTPTNPSPNPAPSPQPVTPPASKTSRSADSGTPRSTGNTTVTLTPNGNTTQPTALPGDTVVELSAPATLTTITADKEVTKVEYYVGKKLIATVSRAPYSHSIDTTKFRNATYTLTAKTYYKDGTIAANNSSLVVKNSFSLTQVYLQLRPYTWLILGLFLLGGLIIVKVRSNRRYKNPYATAGGNEFTIPRPPVNSALIADPPNNSPTMLIEPTQKRPPPAI